MKPFLPKSELVDEVYYKGDCRNASMAIWDAEHNLFWYMRCKWGTWYPEDICHPEDDNGFDLYYPYEVGEPTEEQKIEFDRVKSDHRDAMARRAEWAAKNKP